VLATVVVLLLSAAANRKIYKNFVKTFRRRFYRLPAEEFKIAVDDEEVFVLSGEAEVIVLVGSVWPATSLKNKKNSDSKNERKIRHVCFSLFGKKPADVTLKDDRTLIFD
jgi:hypothetical protein